MLWVVTVEKIKKDEAGGGEGVYVLNKDKKSLTSATHIAPEVPV